MAEAGRASHLHMRGDGLMTLAWTQSQASKGLAVASGRQASDAIVILTCTAIGRCSLAYV